MDVDDSTVTRLTEREGCWSLLDIKQNLVVAEYSSLNVLPHLVVYYFDQSRIFATTAFQLSPKLSYSSFFSVLTDFTLIPNS